MELISISLWLAESSAANTTPLGINLHFGPVCWWYIWSFGFFQCVLLIICLVCGRWLLVVWVVQLLVSCKDIFLLYGYSLSLKCYVDKLFLLILWLEFYITAVLAILRANLFIHSFIFPISKLSIFLRELLLCAIVTAELFDWCG